jgi:hypothetical protein
MPRDCYRTISNKIPSGLQQRETIYAWSGNLLNVLENDHDQNTKLLGRAIFLGLGSGTSGITAMNFPQTNVEIKVNEGHWFIMEAVWGCRDIENTYPDNPQDPHQPDDPNANILQDDRHETTAKATFQPNYFEGFYDQVSTSIKSKESIDIDLSNKVYPNPTTGSFTVQMPQSGNYTIRVMNLVGSTVYEGEMKGEQKKSIQLDQNLPPGNYTIHIHGDGLRHVEKLVITK